MKNHGYAFCSSLHSCERRRDHITGSLLFVLLTLLIGLSGCGSNATGLKSSDTNGNGNSNPSTPGVPGGPVLFFSDLSNGPATGNSDSTTHVTDGGAYVTLYGNFFGSTQGSSTITLNGASCLQVVNWGQSWLWYQKIVVQLTAACSSGNFVVTTGIGMSNNLPFTVAPGSIYYVSMTGSDSGNGSFATPFRTFLHGVNTAGAGAGNIVYVKDGYSDNSQDPRGWGGGVWNPDAETCHGSQNAMDAVVAYPGASVTIGSPTSITPSIRSVDNGSDICPGYWTVSGIKFVAGTDNVILTGDALTNTQAHYWRWIANDVSNPNSNSGEGANFETSQVWNESVYGNYFHDMNLGTTSNLSQGVYPSSDTDHFDMGWNRVHNAKGRATIQIHSSPLSGSSNGFGLYDLKIHDNMIDGSSEECILVDTTNPANGPVLVYNNVIWGCGQDLMASNGDNLRLSGSGDFTQLLGNGYGTWVEFYNNTVYCTDGQECSGSAYTDNKLNNAPALSQHNQLLLSSCTGSCVTAYRNVPYFLVSNGCWGASGCAQGSSFYCATSAIFSQCPWAQGSNNLVFGNGGPTFTNLYTGTINLDPKLANPAAADFHLQAGSPASGAGVASWSFPATGAMTAESGTAPKYDIDGRIRANPPSIGAYE